VAPYATGPLQAKTRWGPPTDDAGTGPDGTPRPLSLLRPGTTGVCGSSGVGVLLRHVILTADVGLFEGALALMEEVSDAGPNGVIAALQAAAAALRAGHQLPIDGGGIYGGVTSSAAVGPAGHHAAYLAALDRRDYPAAVASLHALFDVGYGVGVGGLSPTQGITTAIALLSRAGLSAVDAAGGAAAGPDAAALASTRLSLSGPFARARDLLLASATPPPVAGVLQGRQLTAYPLLQLAATELAFGHGAAAAAAARECLRTAHATGDRHCASLALQLLGDAEHALLAGETDPYDGYDEDNDDNSGGGSGNDGADADDGGAVLTVTDGGRRHVESLLATAARAFDLGLWRQAVGASLQAAEVAAGAAPPHRTTTPASSAARTAAAAVPDWLTLDAAVAARPGMWGVDPRSSSSSASSGGGGGGGATAGGGGSSSGALPPALMLAPPTVAIAAAHARRVRAKEGAAGASAVAGAAAGAAGGNSALAIASAAAALVLPPPGQPLQWSHPQPLSAGEVTAAHARAHAARAAALRAAGQHALADAALACASVAAAAAAGGAAP
jgi:hypothetical protein